jgi:hypothetical protein
VLDGLADPFETAALRERVLTAWAASPARFREDANAEDDYALGGYRDRVVVELAQNAADAAARAGVPGRLRLTLRDGTLEAANTGASLDATGVEALATLRASGKRGAGAPEGTVGRFGVGFAAVVAVSEAPRISSVTGGVRWSRARTRDLVGRIPSLAAELAVRSEHVPVLRLPFPDDGAPPDGYATAVTLPLRDAGAVRLVERLLAETGPALLLALPALAEVSVTIGDRTRVLTAEHHGDGVTITDDGVPSRWRTSLGDGLADPALLAGRPAEERHGSGPVRWYVRWAVPVTGPGGGPGAGELDVPAGRLPDGVGAVVHAPTPTDEPLGLPALLLASFPLGSDRRHVAPGPLTEFLTERAAQVYVRLLPALAPGPGLLDLVPGPVARGEVDARLRAAIAALLPEVPFLPAAEVSVPRVRPRDAIVLETARTGLVDFLAPVFPGLVGGPARHQAYQWLGMRRLSLAELADSLASLDRPPSWWRRLYDALAEADPREVSELGALPVPLADGRLVRGPRGLLLPTSGITRPDRLALLGLRVAHPDAAHPLLARLGAVEATPRSVLAHPAAQAAVEASAHEASADEADPASIADVVLDLVAAAAPEPGEYPWLADLSLPGADGDWYAADELLLPGGELASLVGSEAPFGMVRADIVARYGDAALEAVGVLGSFGLVTARDVDLRDPDIDVDGAAEWAAEVRARLLPGPVPLTAPEVLAVRDLEFVDPGRWPRALELLARPPLRAALVEPTRVLLADGRHTDVPSYTAWWLRRHPVLGGLRPSDVRAGEADADADADPLLAGLYDPAGPSVAGVLADAAVARALGVRTSLAGLLAEPGGPDELLGRLADPARAVSRGQLRRLWAALAAAFAADAAVTPPDLLRAVRGDSVVVVSADEVMVLDAPDLWPLAADTPLVLAPYSLAADLADLLDVPLVSEEIAGRVSAPGRRAAVPAIAREVLPDAPESYETHETLLVDGVRVPWRYADGVLHAEGGAAGLASGLAWAAGQWPARHLLASLLTDPAAGARLLAEADLDPAGLTGLGGFNGFRRV